MKKQNSNLRVLSHFAILMLTLLLAVASTASWYDRTARDDEAGAKLTYDLSDGIKVNGSGLVTKTYLGTSEKGIVTYSESEYNPDEAITVKSGEIAYFKTVVQNTTNKGGALFSVYAPALYCSSNVNELSIGIIGPEKTFVTYTSSNGLKTGTGVLPGKEKSIELICIEDNIYIENGTDNEPKTIEIYWFVKTAVSSGDSTVYSTVYLDAPYVVYN